MNKMTLEDLKYKQSLPLDVKVAMTKNRIREWVREFGVSGVYVSFSGGKDSTVLLHIAREVYPNIKAVFCDTGLEYPEIREFVKQFDNVEWIRPSMNFKEVITTYGYPFISKEVSFVLNTAKNFIEHPEQYEGRDPLPVQDPGDEYKPYSLLQLEGKIRTKRTGEHSQYNFEKWHFMLDAPYHFSAKCCNEIKKKPFHKYNKEHGCYPITAQMAEESRLRKKNWLLHGCNMFDAKNPVSNPMAFWTEQDVLTYIKQNDIEIASVYGDIVYVDKKGAEYTEVISTDGLKLKTTKLDRTGCMFCGYGCHLDKGKGRFELMRETHPKQYAYIMKPLEEGGLDYKAVIDWINEHGNIGIKY